MRVAIIWALASLHPLPKPSVLVSGKLTDLWVTGTRPFTPKHERSLYSQYF